VQFHPEKHAYEWKPHVDVDHAAATIEVGHYFGDFFVAETRKNKRHFPTYKDEKKVLIYNYYPIQISESFMSVYIFSKYGKKAIHRAINPKNQEKLDEEKAKSIPINSTENSSDIPFQQPKPD